MKTCSIISRRTNKRASGLPWRSPQRALALLLLAVCGTLARAAQVPAATGPALGPTPRFALPTGPLTLRQPALPSHPFTVTGRSGAILGMQDGSVEVWQLPVKFFSGLHLTAEVEGYTVPLDLNAQAAELEVSPSHATLTYSNAAITVRQHMFVPAGEASEEADSNGGGVLLFEIEAIHPATLTISLTPAMVREWPAPQYGTPGASWLPLGSEHPGGTGGAYVLSTDNPHLFGMIGMAGATSGDLSPYQERPHTLPLQFKLHFDPAKDSGHLFPLLCELNRADEVNSDATVNAMAARMVRRAAALPALYARTQAFYDHFFDTRLTTSTPDPRFDLALRWAELAIDKAQVTTAGETGLVAGWYPSFDSARPGFGWYFGRDTLWSMYAIDSYGDRELARRAFEFLIRRQRADGKMPHEWSLSAGLLTGEMSWANFPYEYAAADSTPLYLLAMRDYVRSTGDLAFLRANWASLRKAYTFERTHDSDGDGLYDNAEGTGWVEGWPPKPPHQELYLASLDRDATLAMADLARLLDDTGLFTEATSTAAKLAASVEAYRRPDGAYAFSRNADGTYDPTLTVYPSVALWFSAGGMAHPATMLTDWAGSHFSTDWGTRSLADTDPLYDPISYHQGTVWPLFTGWTSLAAYNSDRPLAGWAALARNVGLTWAGDPGAVTEVLSGRFYQPLGRSSTHQLWSSAMTLAPAARGLFGLAPDAPAHTLFVHPHLPAGWPSATLGHVRVGDGDFTVSYRRAGEQLVITVTGTAPSVLCLRAGLPPVGTASLPCAEPSHTAHVLNLPLPAVEVDLPSLGLPAPGATTAQPRIVSESYTARSATLVVEAPGSTVVDLQLHRNARANPKVEGGTRDGDTVHVTTPAGPGFTMQTVSLTW